MSGRPGTYATLDRTWADGDLVSFELPMPFRLARYAGVDRDRDEERCALEYGPVLMALLGAEELDMPAEELPRRLTPLAGKPLHFGVAGHPDCTYPPYWRVQDELFTCFPTMR